MFVLTSNNNIIDEVPDSPPRRRKVFVSDSDDDNDFQNIKKEKSPELPEKSAPCAPGRKRVMKTISVTEKDADGYIGKIFIFDNFVKTFLKLFAT